MRKRKGFTLIELLIVVMILGILAGVVVVVINPGRTKGKAQEGVLKSQMSKLAGALEAYRASEGGIPTDVRNFCNYGVAETNYCAYYGAPGYCGFGRYRGYIRLWQGNEYLYYYYQRRDNDTFCLWTPHRVGGNYIRWSSNYKRMDEHQSVWCDSSAC